MTADTEIFIMDGYPSAGEATWHFPVEVPFSISPPVHNTGNLSIPFEEMSPDYRHGEL